MKLILKSQVAIFIYGIFNSAGQCLYVGQTSKPDQRKRFHLKGKFSGCEFRPLRQTDWQNANRLERQIGLAYQRRGEAKFCQRFHLCRFNFLQRIFPDLKARMWDILDKQDFSKYHVQEIAEATGIRLSRVYDYRQRHRIPVKKWIKPKRQNSSGQ